MLSERFDRLAALRGDPVKGLPESAWKTNLDDLDRDLLLRAVIAATRQLLLADWDTSRKEDRRPQLAIEAAEAWLATKSPESMADAKAAAKECTAARNETFGGDHRIPEAARACSWAVGAKDNTSIWEALQAIEGHLLARIALVGDYQKIAEQRRSILKILRQVIDPPPPAADTATSTDPVPYAASGNFAVGQKLVHAKFGDVLVTAAGDKWIDVQLTDGSTKRLAQKPK